ncbi:GntR family transcriptional regulator [Ottowia testudinis]|uniref:GntR family transcriptional regulator n=1 Tax=Ottowia testudinis TaxID=2816950 RepID=A0A975H3D2_9BURK|nr:GntR family transcriptional regulator [Ottowia testudinis]QTD45709.1 GntR family transcriptional regulator [Ottowia testudinis]
MVSASRLTNQHIYDRIYAAISERRLLPGTKLSEEKLATAFHASRTRVREVLLRLSQELIIEVHPNRGAFVAKPTVGDVRQVFAVRRALEPAIVTELAERRCLAAPDTALGLLREHLAAEAAARAQGNRLALARLTGEFHVSLARATGNRLFTDSLRRLVALTGLMIAQYAHPGGKSCPEHDHDDIVNAIERGDAASARTLTLRHLGGIEADLLPASLPAGEPDFAQIFGLDELSP